MVLDAHQSILVKQRFNRYIGKHMRVRNSQGNKPDHKQHGIS